MLKKIQKGVDTVTTTVAAIMLAAMFLVITANVILRYLPSTNGFSWYMEFSQYANVWAMLIGACGIAVMGTNLRVEAVDSILGRVKGGKKIAKIIVDIAELVFYIIMTRAGYILATKAKQTVSTMPKFRMGQVYAIFPVAGVLCVIAVLIHLAVTLTEKEEEV